MTPAPIGEQSLRRPVDQRKAPQVSEGPGAGPALDILSRYRKPLVEAMGSLLGGPRSPILDMSRYHMGLADEGGALREDVAGKLLRPTLCLAVCEALGGDISGCLPAAISIEVIHRTSLVFDDIQDRSPRRNHRQAIWEMQGVDEAINVGLALSCYARLSLHGMLEHQPSPNTVLEVHRLLEQAALGMCRGQHIDLQFQQATSEGAVPTLSEYLEMVRLKTCVLVGAACEVGALVAGSTDQREAARSFGESLGVAFQLQDDSLGVWGHEANMGKLPVDLEQRKWGLPAVLAMQQRPGEFVDLLGASPQDRQATKLLGAILDSQEIREKAQDLTVQAAKRAQALLEQMALASAWKDELGALTEFVVTRAA